MKQKQYFISLNKISSFNEKKDMYVFYGFFSFELSIAKFL